MNKGMPLASDYAALSELLLEIVAILMLFEQATFSTGFNLKLKSFSIFSFGLKFLKPFLECVAVIAICASFTEYRNLFLLLFES